MFLKSSFILSGLILVINGQDSYNGRRHRPDCRHVRCGPPPPCRVENLYIPEGECCFDCRPDFEKPGRCPHVGSSFGICISQCTRDNDCPGRSKCCSNGCGQVCSNPVFDWWPICDVVCPLVRCPFGQYTPPGGCCPVCIRPPPPLGVDCSDVDVQEQCPRLTCSRQFIPPGQCCPVCARGDDN